MPFIIPLNLLSPAYGSLAGGEEQKEPSGCWSRADICGSGVFARGYQITALLDMHGTHPFYCNVCKTELTLFIFIVLY